MKAALMSIIAFFILGCGNASEPPAKVTVQNKDAPDDVQLPEQKVEDNKTITHIRVLVQDSNSKIPEYLVKVPINLNRKVNVR